MNLFGKKESTEPTASAPLSEYERAEHAVEAANARIAAVNEEFNKLVAQYQVRVDRAGNIAFAIVPDFTKRDEIENLCARTCVAETKH